MCDEGRFGWKYIHSDQRLTFPSTPRRTAKSVPRDWDDILPSLRKALTKARGQGIPSKSAAVFSPWMTVEEAYLLASYLRGLSPKVKLALGPVQIGRRRRHATRRTFHGKPVEPAKFTIRAEKARTAAACEMVLNHFAGAATTLGDLRGRRRPRASSTRSTSSAAIRPAGSNRRASRRASARRRC